VNLLVLTKIAKYTLLASISALLSFSASFNTDTQLLLACVLGGSIFIGAIAVLWEGRDSISAQPTEEGLTSLLTSMNGTKPRKEYLLSPSARLEIVIGLVVASIAVLIGAL
jgi:hypothetical protein